MKLHRIQKKLLDLFDSRKEVRSMSFRVIGKQIGISHPEQVKHHILQLEKKGYIRRGKNNIIMLKNPVDEIVYVPLWGVAYCGSSSTCKTIAPSRIKERIPISTRAYSVVEPETLIMVKAIGNSMEPTIKEGDFVLVDTGSKVNSGTIGLVKHNGKFRIKKIVKVDNKKYLLQSLNNPSQNEPEFVNKSSRFTIVGRVKGLISSFS